MVLNLTTEVYLSILSVIFSIIAAILIFQQNNKNEDRALVFIGVAYSCLAIYFMCTGLGYMLLNTFFYMLKNVFLILLVLFITMAITQMMYDKMITLILVIMSFISSFALFVYLLPNNVEMMTFDNGEKSLTNVGYNRVIIAMLFLYVVAIILYFSAQIYINSPKEFRSDSRLFFLGNLILGVFGLGSFISGISLIIPGIVELSVSIGILISSIGLINTPQILYILPFKAIKLSIINSNTGISMYNYHWTGNIDHATDQLFGAAFMSITNFMQETIGEGNIEEVRLEGTTIIIKKPAQQSYYYVVIATKSSYTLKKGLEQFANRFHDMYGTIIEDQIHDLQEYQAADEIIPECFPYIPSK